MAEYRVPTKTYTYYETPQLFKIYTFYDEGGECVNFIIQFQILEEKLDGIGDRDKGEIGDLIVTIDGSKSNVDAWLDLNGNLVIQDFNGDKYSLDLDGDVIFEC